MVKRKLYKIRVKNRFGTYDSNKNFYKKSTANKVVSASRKADSSLSNRGLKPKNKGLFSSEFKTKNQYRVVKAK